MGKKGVEWTEQGREDLRAIEQLTALRILKVVARYIASGDGDVKRLQNTDPPELRLRVGDYRVRFYDLDISILIIAVKHRKDAYR